VKITWEKGERKEIVQTEMVKGKPISRPRLGKNGGPVIQQTVVKVIDLN